uniref:Uncharacterized protein n=1 Tax=Wuchereria bancrofti TaxID=6293 RepID=A0A1I8EY81_WUCBA
MKHSTTRDETIQEFLQQLKEPYQRSRQNRDNLLLLIEWLFISNRILAERMLLQRNDLRKLMEFIDSVCKTKEITVGNNEFKGGLVSKFKVETINADLEILIHNQEVVNSIPYQHRDEFLKQLENQFNQVTRSIQEKLESLIIRWRLMTLCKYCYDINCINCSEIEIRITSNRIPFFSQKKFKSKNYHCSMKSSRAHVINTKAQVPVIKHNTFCNISENF